LFEFTENVEVVPESLFNANMTLLPTIKDEEKVENLSRRGIEGHKLKQ
jgi:hypothetical protein